MDLTEEKRYQIARIIFDHLSFGEAKKIFSNDRETKKWVYYAATCAVVTATLKKESQDDIDFVFALVLKLIDKIDF